MTDLHSKVDVMCEILRRVECQVTKQNGNVARLTDWQIQHIEQDKARDAAVQSTAENISTLTEELRPVRAMLRYPVIFAIGLFVIGLSAVLGAVKPVVAIFNDLS